MRSGSENELKRKWMNIGRSESRKVMQIKIYSIGLKRQQFIHRRQNKMGKNEYRAEKKWKKRFDEVKENKVKDDDDDDENKER